MAEKFGRQIIDRPLRYYPFCFLFAAPFMWANWVSLRGIEVGWLWEIFASLVVFYLIWFIYYELKLRNQRHALLLYEARQDNLTQLYNFRVFNEDLNRAFRDYHKNGTRYLLYTFDVDHFKRVNDRYGHLEGNAVLRKVAAELKQIVPEISSHAEAYRVGGEEFSILVFDVETQHCSANMAANRVRKAIGNLNFTTQQGEQFQITISMGQDQIDAEDQNYLDLYKRADKRLYRSKEAGRNRVTTSDVG
ncbi:GGDEF domain-containing protein [Secundilactobacillus silagei]|uniref:GGDEF domain-containing protein n=1 Tax=Secundilactobacillus silagei TaxID=1293415 RepID=UPI0020935EC1|nr:GGDEF domain-containing protein [Secundilactobacillus silagei]